MSVRARVSRRRLPRLDVPSRGRFRLVTLAGFAALVATLSWAMPAGAWPPAVNGRLAFDQGDGIVTANADGTEVRDLAPAGCCATWAPSGDRLAVTDVTADGRFTYALVGADGTDRSAAFDFGVPGLNVGYEAWSPDGELIAGEVWDDGDPDHNGIALHAAGKPGTLTKVLATPGRRNQVGDFSPAGDRLVFVQYAGLGGDAKRALFVMDRDGSDVDQITPWGMAGCCTASWSPNGRWIVFDDHGRLFAVHPDGTGLRQVPVHPGGRYFAFEPDWSPDGTRIAFSMFVIRNGQDDIFTAAPDGTDLIQVTDTPGHEGQVDWGTAPELRAGR
jgi:Tol biopolymer transport system component